MAAGTRHARTPAFVLEAEELHAGFAGVKTCSGLGQCGTWHGVPNNPLGTRSPYSDKVGATLARGEGAAVLVSGEVALR